IGRHGRIYKAGSVAGRFDGKYWRINVEGVSYTRSLLVWMIHHGVRPLNDLDHIDQDKLNDRIENLRDVLAAQNNRNRNGRDGTCYPIWLELIQSGYYRNIVQFSLLFWPDEPAAEITDELNSLVTPTIDKVFFGRAGRLCPPRRPVN